MNKFTKRKKVSVKGHILMNLVYRAGQMNKKSFCKFSLAEGARKIHSCICFDTVADEASNLLPQDEIVVSGYLDEMDELIVNSFIKGSGTSVVKEISNKLDKERMKDVLATEAKQMALGGYVRVSRTEDGEKYWYWEHVDYCLETETGWTSMIEYLMDCLSPEIVAGMLRERLGLTVDKAVKINIDPVSYKAWLRNEVDKVIREESGVIRV